MSADETEIESVDDEGPSSVNIGATTDMKNFVNRLSNEMEVTNPNALQYILDHDVNPSVSQFQGSIRIETTIQTTPDVRERLTELRDSRGLDSYEDVLRDELDIPIRSRDTEEPV